MAAGQCGHGISIGLEDRDLELFHLDATRAQGECQRQMIRAAARDRADGECRRVGLELVDHIAHGLERGASAH